MRLKFVILTSILLLAVLGVPSVYSQFYFGKNKVQYTTFDWKVMETDHFRIYFYEEEREIAGIAAYLAEESYRELAAKFNHEVKDRIPLIIYSTPSYFSQTNVVPGLLPESVAGFTEFMKGRVVVPFYGNYHAFAHVIKHEMVHVFQISKTEEVLTRQAKVRFGYPPLWFTEGHAEFWSKEWDTEADMIVKDLVLSGRLPSIEQMYVVHGTYYMYKLGESICTFIDSTYGPDKLIQIYENWPKATNFEEVVKITLGEDINEVSRKWEYSLQKRYFPSLGDQGLPKMESQQLSRDGYAVEGVPIRWDDGEGLQDWIVFMANKRGYTGIYMRKAHDKGGNVRTLVKGEQSARFESLHLLRSGIDANDSGQVIFSSKSNERDVIYLYDLNKGKVVEEYEFADLVAARSPRLSTDRQRVVFSGAKKSGTTDIYLLDLQTKEYKALTSDVYHDTDPTFIPDSNKIVFVSDRDSYGQSGASNLFLLDLDHQTIEQLTSGPYKDQSPSVTANGIYFSSDRLGSFNLFLLAEDGTLTRQSTFATGAFDPRLSSDGKQLVYTGYQDQMFQIFEMGFREHIDSTENPLPDHIVAWMPPSVDRKVADASIAYDADYSFDIAQSAVAYDPVNGSVGGLQAAISDVLGNRSYHFLVTNTAETKDEILSAFNLGVTYINRERQINWGAGLFHLYDEYYNDYDLYYNERQAGGIGLMSYPLSKFQRLETTVFARYSKKDLRYGQKAREAFLVSNYLSWVYDNALWDISGPLEGRRYNITVGLTNSITDMRNFNRMASADIRHYFRLGQYSALANRIWMYTSDGQEPQRTYLGGSWSFRGFDRKHWYSRNIMFASNELRFPLINDLLINSPIGALGFRGIRGALFFDVGSGWDEDFDQLYGSFGAGVRVNLGYVVQLRFDFSRTTDFERISRNTDFDFFFGWNF